jgi:hypothetical protein
MSSTLARRRNEFLVILQKQTEVSSDACDTNSRQEDDVLGPSIAGQKARQKEVYRLSAERAVNKLIIPLRSFRLAKHYGRSQAQQQRIPQAKATWIFLVLP